MQAITYESFFDGLLTAVPEYRACYDDDLRFYGELLPHVFLGAFVQFLDDALSAATGPDLLDRALTYLERAIQSDDLRVVNLVAVSFVENLPGNIHFGDIVQRMPRHLRAEVRQQRLEP
jgi:hypothetical protein